MSASHEAVTVRALTVWLLVAYQSALLGIHGATRLQSFSRVTVSGSWVLPDYAEKAIPKGKAMQCSLHCLHNASCNAHNEISADETTCKLMTIDLGLMFMSFLNGEEVQLDATYFTNAIIKLPDLSNGAVFDDPLVYLFPLAPDQVFKDYVVNLRTGAVSETRMLQASAEPDLAKFPLCYNRERRAIFLHQTNGDGFWQYSTGNGTWTTLAAAANMPGRTSYSVFQLDDECTKIVLAGEYNEVPLQDVQEYDVATNSWSTSSATTGNPMYSFSYARLPGTSTFYVISGFGANAAQLKVTNEVDLTSGTTTPKAQLATPFFGATCGPTKNAAQSWLFVCMESLNLDSPIRVFDVANNLWTLKVFPDLQRVRAYEGIPTPGYDRIYFLIEALPDVSVNGYVYDPIEDTLTEMEGLEPGTLSQYSGLALPINF